MDTMMLKIILGGMGVFLVTQAGMLIWHLSRMNTTLIFIKADLEKAIDDYEARDQKRSHDITLIWNRIDEHKTRITRIEQKCKFHEFDINRHGDNDG